MKKTLVLCHPDYFDVEYELNTNRWMDKNVKPDKIKALAQWRALYEACLKSQSTEVLLAPHHPGLPDMTFVANAGLGYKNKVFILSNYYHKQRRREAVLHKKFFGKLYDWVVELPKNAFFEGQGDAVWVDENTLLVGYGVRTNLAGVKEVEETLKRVNPKARVIGLPMKRPYQVKSNNKIFYHLDTCFLYLPHTKTFLLYADAFRNGPGSALTALQRVSKKIGGEIWVVGREAAHRFMCNSVIINRRTIFMPWVDEHYKKFLYKRGYSNIKNFEMSEFLKSGGAVKCLILEI